MRSMYEYVRYDFSDRRWCQCREGLHALHKTMFDIFLSKRLGHILWKGMKLFHARVMLHPDLNILASAWLSRKIFGINDKVTKSGPFDLHSSNSYYLIINFKKTFFFFAHSIFLHNFAIVNHVWTLSDHAGWGSRGRAPRRGLLRSSFNYDGQCESLNVWDERP